MDLFSNYYNIIGLVAAFAGIASFIWLVYEKKYPLRKISWKRAENGAKKICTQMAQDEFDPSLIFGIGRGGSIMGSLISGCLGHRPQLVVDRKYTWSEKGRSEDLIFRVNIPNKYLQNVLLVAGEAHSGRTMDLYYDYFKKLKARQIKRAVFLSEEGCPTRVEFIGMRSRRKSLKLPWRISQEYITSDMESGPRAESDHQVKVHLVRHAETTAGDDIFVGVTDYPLTVHGIEQALDIGKVFSSKPIKRIYSSPSDRALMTAKVINYFLGGAELLVDESLREINFGEWEGLTRVDIQRKYEKEYDLWQADPHTNFPPMAEPPEMVAERMYNFLNEIGKNQYLTNQDSEIVVVSHKTATRLLLAKLEHLPLRDYRKIPMPNCTVHTLAYSGKHWELLTDLGCC